MNRYLLMFAMLLGFGWSTHAQADMEYGPYTCNECLLGTPTPDIDTNTFIRSVVNNDVAVWRPGDTVEICNSSGCVTYRYSGAATTPFVAVDAEGGGGGGGDPPNHGGGGTPPGPWGMPGGGGWEFDCHVGTRPCSDF